MEVPFSRNPPNLRVVPQLDPRYADMAIGEAYSAYNEKALFADTEISKHLEDARDKPDLTKTTMMFDRIHELDAQMEGKTKRDTDVFQSLDTMTPRRAVIKENAQGITPSTTTESRTPG
jgi:hypothetical protein